MVDFSDPFELLQSALTEFESHNFGKVIHILENGVGIADESPLFFALLSKAYLNVGDYHKSAAIVQLGLEKFPFNRSLLVIDNDLKSNFPRLAVLSDNFKSEDYEKINNIFFHLDFNIIKVLNFRKILV